TSIDESIEKFKNKGGEIIISFGGAINDELALHHEEAQSLANEYKKVINKYHPIQLDFDMEGTSLMDNYFNGKKSKEVHQLRAKALSLLKKELKDNMPKISLCLAVNPDIGLDEKALEVIEAMKEEEVSIDIISIMAMDYGTNYISRGFYKNTMDSLEKAYEQSKSYYPNIKMGVIPMIGENDDGSILSLKDTEKLVNDLKSKDYVQMISMWSINRDKNDGMFTSLIKNTYKYPFSDNGSANENSEDKKKEYQYTSILKKFLN
ncbi:hypothetical protein BCR32DRAFT_199636, partial [Anaeromyces robustus]